MHAHALELVLTHHERGPGRAWSHGVHASGTSVASASPLTSNATDEQSSRDMDEAAATVGSMIVAARLHSARAFLQFDTQQPKNTKHENHT